MPGISYWVASSLRLVPRPHMSKVPVLQASVYERGGEMAFFHPGI